MNRLSQELSALSGLRVNPDWASLPLFDRTSWTSVRFGDVVKNANEVLSDPAAARIDRFIGLEHLEPGSLHVRSWGKIADGTTFTRLCRPGQVLFGKRRAYQRKVAAAEFDAVVSGDIYVLETKGDRLLPDLLPFLCLSERFFQHAVGTSAGSLSPRTNWSSLASFEFDLPPLDQQARIAALCWRSDAAQVAQEALLNDGQQFRRLFLSRTFARKAFPLRRVKDAGTVQLGRQRHPKYQTGRFSHPYLRVANVHDGHIDYSDVLTMDFDAKDFARFRLEPGDILLNEGQSLELVGRCAMFDGGVDDCCFQKTLIRFKCGPDVIAEWALAYFQYCQYFGVFASISLQTTSVAHLTAVRFEAMPMPVPSRVEQEKILQEYHRIVAVIGKLVSQREALAVTRRALMEALIG